MSVLSNMKGVAAKDQQMIRDAETMMGPEPEEMGFIKNMFWGRIREDVVFPYPEPSAAEKAKCDDLVARREGEPEEHHRRHADGLESLHRRELPAVERRHGPVDAGGHQ